MGRNDDEVLDYIIKRYTINKRKHKNPHTSITETNYCGTVIIELEKILKHFNVKINP